MTSSLNYGAIVRVIGRLVLIEALLLLFPLAVCLVYGESEWKSFAVAALSAGAAGGIAEACTLRRPA
ncbi:MAG: hypothetical protein K2H94_02445, partial [Duncaniella sp.]|nr:hypothetical protein [Duncaniella sp.]